MNFFIYRFVIMLTFLLPLTVSAEIKVGIAKSVITPPAEIPSAGYPQRRGAKMQGALDPLYATAIFIDTGSKRIAFCSVDHLGFTYDMVQEVKRYARIYKVLEDCEIFVASSNTHSGGGAYQNIPWLSQDIAGEYNPLIAKHCARIVAKTLYRASVNPTPAKIGIGYGSVEGLTKYTGVWPLNVDPLKDIALIKVTSVDGKPLAALVNFPVHASVLGCENMQFSADFVGHIRNYIQNVLGIPTLYVNGAQAEIYPNVTKDQRNIQGCSYIGGVLGKKLYRIWMKTAVSDNLEIETKKYEYAFSPELTPFGSTLAIESYKSELNLLVLNHLHAFVTIPGELSCVYDQRFKDVGKQFGYEHVSVLGLVNDAHGCIILPDAWKHKTVESVTSFGGERYGEFIEETVISMLKEKAPR